jgi:death on curing protein
VRKPVFLCKDVVLAIHDQLLAEYGGAPGIRDEGLLDSALSRPQQLYSYATPDLFVLAAAYVNGILRNHPFIDGNKRTAFLAGYTFLARNEEQLEADEVEATEVTLALASRSLSEADFSAWLKQHCQSH